MSIKQILDYEEQSWIMLISVNSIKYVLLFLNNIIFVTEDIKTSKTLFRLKDNLEFYKHRQEK